MILQLNVMAYYKWNPGAKKKNVIGLETKGI